MENGLVKEANSSAESADIQALQATDLEEFGVRGDLHFRGDGAAWSVELRTLFVADLHLGKDASFRSVGVPVPSGQNRTILDALTAAIESLPTQRLVILGDFIHDRHSWTHELLTQWRDWRTRHRELEIVLTLGNHDRDLDIPWSKLGIHAVEQWHSRPYLGLHNVKDVLNVAETNGSVVLAGHVHPVVTLGNSVDQVRVPCFWVMGRNVVLPAFGPFKGGFECLTTGRKPALGSRCRTRSARRVKNSSGDSETAYPICDGRIWKFERHGDGT